MADNCSSIKQEADNVVTKIIQHVGKAIAIQANVSVPEDIENLV